MSKKIIYLVFAFLLLANFKIKAQIGSNSELYQDFFFKLGNPDSIVTEVLDTVTFKLVPSGLTKFTYNAACKPTKSVDKDWDKIQKKWLDVGQQLFFYDASNRATTILTQLPSGTVFKDSTRINFVYTGAAKEQTTETEQVYLGGAWVNDLLKEFTYTTTRKVATLVEKSWFSNAWVTDTRKTYTYDTQNRLTIELTEDWDGTKWVNSDRETYTYSAANKLQNIKSESWNPSTNKFEFTGDTPFTVSTDGRTISFAIDFFGNRLNLKYVGNTLGVLSNAEISIGNPPAAVVISNTRFVGNAACPVTASEEVNVLTNVIQLSPNPAGDLLRIHLQNIESDNYTATIYNVAGFPVESFKGNTSVDFSKNTDNLSNGLYFLTIRGNTWQSVQKFVVQK